MFQILCFSTKQFPLTLTVYGFVIRSDFLVIFCMSSVTKALAVIYSQKYKNIIQINNTLPSLKTKYPKA